MIAEVAEEGPRAVGDDEAPPLRAATLPPLEYARPLPPPPRPEPAPAPSRRDEGTDLAEGEAAAPAGEALAKLPVPEGCEGLPAHLVDKVRRRQAVLEVREAEQPLLVRMALIHRLPAMAQAVRACMQEARRRVMPQEELVRKLRQNGKWLTNDAELRAQLALLGEIVPQWCTVVPLGEEAELNVRLNDAVRLAEVLKAIKAAS